jgi:peptide/nickel transport system permease protein
MSYGRFLAERLAWAVFALWLATLIVFVIFRVFTVQPLGPPGWPPSRIDDTYFERSGFVLKRYGNFLWDLGQDGSVGPSFATRRESRDVALRTLPATASLLAAALTIWLALAMAMGLLAARLGWKRLGRAFVYVAIGSSPIWVGLWASYVFSYKLALLPFSYCDFFDPPKGDCGGATDWVRGLVLPALTLAIFFTAIYARVIARVRRVPGEIGGRRRALVVTRMLGRDIGYVLGAAAFVEVVFGIPGLGGTLVAASRFDLPVAESALLLGLWLAITVHLLVDLVVAALDSDLRAEWPVAQVTGRA